MLEDDERVISIDGMCPLLDCTHRDMPRLPDCAVCVPRQPEFRPGDVVRLRSGGVAMTVGEHRYHPGVASLSVRVNWHDKRGVPHEQTYRAEQMERVEP